MKAKFHGSTRTIGLQIALGAIVCGITLMTAPARAGEGDGPLTKVVRFADLNLNGEAGVQTLYGRLRMAATQVCAPFTGNTLREKTQWHECFDPALARSVATIDELRLTAYHLSRAGSTEPPSQVAKDR